jgi:hypothetical protein
LYKAWLVAQGFTQNLGIDYEETYSHVMDSIKFIFLLSLEFDEKLETILMDVETTYLYYDLNTNVYKNVHVGLETLSKAPLMPET